MSTSTERLAMQQNRLIGQGVQVPNMINVLTGGVVTNTGGSRINQSIYQILSTVPGERFFMPDFGSRLHELLFEQNDFILEDMIKLYVKEDLQKWEPRITVTYVNTVIDEHTVNVSISYKLINQNVVNNYVYPFSRGTHPIVGGGYYE